MGLLSKVARSFLGALIGLVLGSFAWYLCLEVVGVDGITRYVDEPEQRSYLWQGVVIYSGPVIGLSPAAWRSEVGPRGLEPRTCGLRVRCSAELS